MSVDVKRPGRAGSSDLVALMASGSLTGLSEGQLLHRYARKGDDAAFRLIVERHGARVMGVCRRVLRDSHAADDAFQATFLILARRAHAIARPDRLGGWLSGVARRVALRARSVDARRTDREQAYARSNWRDGAMGDSDGFDRAALVHEELDRLPPAYRRAIEACYFQGLSTDEAAVALRWPRGTVGTRLSRGKERLRRGLERRGLGLSVALACRPGLPAPLVARTCKAVAAFGRVELSSVSITAGAVPPGVVSLAVESLRSMWMKKLVLIGAVASLSLGATGLLTHRVLANRVEGGAAEAGSVPAALVDDQTAIQGTWVVTHVGANLAVQGTAEGLIGMEWHFKGDILETSIPLGADKGTFMLDPTKTPKTMTLKSFGPDGQIAIYELGTDSLKVAFGGGPGGAPAGFDVGSASNPPAIVLTLVPEAKAPKLTPEQKRANAEAVGKARATAARSVSMNNLKQIGLAIHNYEAAYSKGFPAAAICDKDGKPLLSWRVAILPFIEQEALYQQFHLDEPWDSAHNKALIAKMPRLYAPVGDAQKDAESGTTFYQALVGGGAMFETTKPRSLPTITDGLSNTLMVVEAAEPEVWTKPSDVNFEAEGALPAMGGKQFEAGFNALFGDGSVKFISKSIDATMLRSLITAAGGEKVR